jgi:hypothetical protein
LIEKLHFSLPTFQVINVLGKKMFWVKKWIEYQIFREKNQGWIFW